MKHYYATFIGGLIFLAAAACTNPFNTRSPEPPDPGGGGTTINRNLQTDPDSLVVKLRSAFATRNPQSYGECFADTLEGTDGYQFIPQEAESPRLLGWMLIEEEQYFVNFVNNEALLSVSLQDSVLTRSEPAPGSFQTEFAYTIRAAFLDRVEYYRGQAILFINESGNGLWYVYRWEDFKSTPAATDSTWSTLKANYR